MSSIPDALRTLFARKGITNRKQLNAWCGSAGREKLYMRIKRLAPEHWSRIATPEASTRAAYETMLSGYKHYKAVPSTAEPVASITPIESVAPIESGATWRVLINPKLWDQKEFVRKFNELPEESYLRQSKGRCVMRSVPKTGDTILFVIKGRVVMKGIMESDGFEIGSAHRVHSCNRPTL